MKVNNDFSDIRNGQHINVSSNYGTEEEFKELVKQSLKENDWNPSKEAKTCINGQIKNYLDGK